MSLTRSLTRPLTRKISRADLTQGFGGSFSPFALDPYLLFDARDSMVGTLENPTLDLNPALPETLDVITATRAGVATYTDPDGLIATASADTVRVDYTQGDELTPTVYQLVSNTNFGGWVIKSNTTLTSNTTETLSPDGTNNATKMTSNGSEGLYIPSLGTASLNTKSIFLKGVSGGEQVILQDPHQNIDPLTCTLTTEWQRFHLTQTQTGSFGLWLTNIPSGGIYAYGPQVQVLGLTDFVANTTGSPKFITGATYGPRVPMILVEPSATNLVEYSEDFSQWAASNVDRLDGIPSPDGLTNAQNIQPSATSGVHLILSDGASSAIKTYSVYAKANGYKYFRFNTGSSSNGFAEFDVESGAVVGSGGTYYSTSSIEDVGDGWFRCSMTFSAGAATTIYIVLEDNSRSSSFIGDGTSGMYFWGAQVEAGSVATSYIPTSGGNAAARTRAADDLEITGSAFSDFYNQSEGTTYVETVPRTTDDYRHLYEYSQDGDNRMNNFLHLNNNRAYFETGNVTQASLIFGATSLNQINRIATSYKTNDLVGSSNGSSEVTDTTATLPTAMSKLLIGAYLFGSHLNGHIKRLLFWPTHSSRL